MEGLGELTSAGDTGAFHSINNYFNIFIARVLKHAKTSARLKYGAEESMECSFP